MGSEAEIERPALRPTVMTVSLPALTQNLSALSAKLSSSKLMAVVKANAYGLSLIHI